MDASASRQRTSFRTMRVDTERPMPIVKGELGEEDEELSNRRANAQVQTGVDASEADEVHLRRAMDKQATLGSAEAIPTPQIREGAEVVTSRYERPAKYVRFVVPHWSDKSAGVLYDMDAADLAWLESHNGARRGAVTERDFEAFIDALEKATAMGEKPAPLSTLALPRPASISASAAEEIHAYWVAKRASFAGRRRALLRHFWPQPEHENPDATIAFRPIERSYSRRARPNDRDAYDKMCVLFDGFATLREILRATVEREQKKRELVLAQDEVFKQLCLEDRRGSGRTAIVLDLEREAPVVVAPPPRFPTSAFTVKVRPPRRESSPTSDEDEDHVPPRARDRDRERNRNRDRDRERERERKAAALAEEGDSSGYSYSAMDLVPFAPAVAPRVGLKVTYAEPGAAVRLAGTAHLDELVEVLWPKRPLARSRTGVTRLASPPCKVRAVRRIGRGGRVLLERVVRMPVDARSRPIRSRAPGYGGWAHGSGSSNGSASASGSGSRSGSWSSASERGLDALAPVRTLAESIAARHRARRTHRQAQGPLGAVLGYAALGVETDLVARYRTLRAALGVPRSPVFAADGTRRDSTQLAGRKRRASEADAYGRGSGGSGGETGSGSGSGSGSGADGESGDSDSGSDSGSASPPLSIPLPLPVASPRASQRASEPMSSPRGQNASDFVDALFS